ncbi:hypothetical protein J4440_05975 [Candidatus Woesearchaeota archaeon]|nr:hypothetical protein [Candidatus Woesearchaeota archaeon]
MVKKEMKNEVMCRVCKMPYSECGCAGKMHFLSGLVLLVLGVLLWGNSVWSWASWFNLEHVVVLLLVLAGLKKLLMCCMLTKCH